MHVMQKYSCNADMQLKYAYELAASLSDKKGTEKSQNAVICGRSLDSQLCTK
jgi:hypothetical protein